MTIITNLLWLLNRVVVATVIAALTGVLASVVIAAYILLTDPSGEPPYFNPHLWIFTIEYGAIVGAVSGVLPGTAVMCLSRARLAPWRSAPMMLLGTTLGILVLGLPFGLLRGSVATTVVILVMLVVGPTIGGIIAVRFIPNAPGA